MEDVAKIEILDAINSFATHVDERFVQIDRRFDQIDQRFEKIDQRFEKMDRRFEHADARMDTFATKDDLVREVDRFIAVHQKLDVEIVALRARSGRIESFLVKVADKLGLEFHPS